MSSVRDEEDRRYMMRALRLAQRGRGTTSPNPTVGAVVVRNRRIVGEGWHCRPGLDHAEVMALSQAGARARGATMYVTLEPCAHTGRTPPCVDALVRSGIQRCVVAVRDPHAIVNGRGLRGLKRSGMKVEVGLCAAESRKTLGGYWLVHTRGRPRVTWKVAATLDGKIADGQRRSRWITGAESRRHGHRLRAEADAVVIGSGTARADDPRLTARGVNARRQPLRVVCDTQLRLPLSLRLFRPVLARGTVVACGTSVPAHRVRALEARGATVWRLPLRGGGVSPLALARRLATRGCHEVLLESGPGLGTAWLRAGVVDRIALFMAPRVLGAEGLSWCGSLGRRHLARALEGRIAGRGAFGSDAFLLVEVGGH
ncbi:MAG: bifunctional diaminohydroxyphosphoribosylaminopyrimidine deaminase/5-amino-6-(5-phosphoribosylamino)uracil reductase RibD [bacterium]